MNMRRVAVVLVGASASVLLLAGAVLDTALMTALGQVLAFAAVGLVGLMLSRQMAAISSARLNADVTLLERQSALEVRLRQASKEQASQLDLLRSLQKRAREQTAALSSIQASTDLRFRRIEATLLEAGARAVRALEAQGELADGARALASEKAEDQARSMREGFRSIASSLDAAHGAASESGQLAVNASKRAERAVRALSDRYTEDKQKLVSSLSDSRKLRSISRVSMAWLKVEVVREVEALQQLRLLLDMHEATPLLGDWAMDPASMHAVVELVLRTKPAMVVELGGGSSTIWIAAALRKLGAGKIVSFEHQIEFRDRTVSAIERLGLTDFAEVRLAQLCPVELERGQFNWYSLRHDDVPGAVDLLLVDGPPTAVGPMARYPALPVLGRTLSDKALIIVDDAARPDERKMIEAWEEDGYRLKDEGPLGPRTKLFSVEKRDDGLNSRASVIGEVS